MIIASSIDLASIRTVLDAIPKIATQMEAVPKQIEQIVQTQVPKIVESIVEAHLPKQPSSDSILSPAHLAVKVETQLRQQKLSTKFEEDPNGTAVLTQSQQADVIEAAKISEEQMVAHLSPFLWPWIHTAGADHRCLVNSETTPWLEVEPGVAKLNKKPDLWIGPYYIVNALSSPDPTTSAGLLRAELSKSQSFRYVFGTPIHSVWYDSVFALAAKRNLSGEAFGEEIIYLKYLSQGPHSFSRGMVFDANRFYLLICQKGEITSRVIAGWNQRGSGELVRNFFSVESKWENAIRYFCHLFGVVPLRHLGSGGTGRVIEVMDVRQQLASPSDNPHFALKVVLEEHLQQLTVEYERIRSLIESRNNDDVLNSVLPHSIGDFRTQENESSTLVAGAFLLGPVGQPLVCNEVISNQTTFVQVFQSLRILHQGGVRHGDPRLPNLLKRVQPVRHSDRHNAAHQPEDSRSPMYSMYYDPSGRPFAVTAASSSSASSLPTISSSASLVSSPSPTTSHPFFWVDFMIPDTSFILHSTNPSHRFHDDLLLFIGYLIGKRQTRDSLSAILNDYHLKIQQDDLFEQYAATVFEFIKQQRGSN